MIFQAFSEAGPWFQLLVGAAHVGFGAVLGFLYFTAVHATAQRLAQGAAKWPTIGLILGRLALMAGGLVLASLEGAMPLIATAAGVFAGRWLVMRANREPAQ